MRLLSALLALVVGCRQPAPSAPLSHRRADDLANVARTTHEPHSQAQLEALSTLELDTSFRSSVRKLAKGYLDVVHTRRARPRLDVFVTIQPCGDCIPLQAARWRATKRQTLAPELRARPDTTFELGEVSLVGEKLIYVYQLGWHFSTTGGAYSNAYILYYNDGVNQIRVVAQYADDIPGSKEALARALPREQLEQIAGTAFDLYTAAWVN